VHHSGIGLLPVHRQEVPEGEAPVRAEGFADHGNRRYLQAGGRQPSAIIRDAHDRARIGHRALPNRQVVVLRPKDWTAWIHLTKREAELLRPIPEGSLEVRTVREGTG
jgi:hypothetical protein